jgi:hypothetical protein
MEPVWRTIYGWPSSDYPDLARHPERWAEVLKALKVFQFTSKFALQGDAAQIRPLLQVLKAHRVKIALAGAPLVATTACGLGVESFGTPDETLLAAKRLASLGAAPDIVAFDEPLYYGHFFRAGATTKGCRLGVAQVVDEIAARERMLLQAFPGLEIGDVEPYGLDDVTPSDWTKAYGEFLARHREKTGHDWGFVQVDVTWARPDWRPQLLPDLRVWKARSIPWGVMYTAPAGVPDDAAWSRAVGEAATAFQQRLGLRPDQVVIASWTDHPRRLLPEQDPTTMTGAALTFLQRFGGLKPSRLPSTPRLQAEMSAQSGRRGADR